MLVIEESINRDFYAMPSQKHIEDKKVLFNEEYVAEEYTKVYEYDSV